LSREKIIEKKLCEASLYQFLRSFWSVIIKEPFVDNWHIEYLCDLIQENVERVIRREPKLHDIVINVPPGSSKSTIVSIMLEAWAWTVDPTLKFITGSFEKSLATDLSVKARDILKSDKFVELWGDIISFKSDEDGKTAYSNSAGGSRRVCTVGSNITGFHAHVLVVDDPLPTNRSISEADRKSANEWIDGTLSMRKVDKAISLTIYIQQRLAEDDTTGHVLKNHKNILHICLPGEITELENVKPPELADKYIDGLLDPKRLSREILAEAKIKLGSRGYAKQILQYPSAAEGSVFKRKYWKFYRELPDLKKIRIVQSWDTALKAKEQNDFWCCTTWIEYIIGFYMIDFSMEKMESPAGKASIKGKYYQFKPTHVLIEDKAAGSVLIQELQDETTIPIYPVQVGLDKVTRAWDAVPAIETGNVYLPETAPWTQPLIDRLALFPDGKNDDDADSITQFLNWIRVKTPGMPWIMGRKPKDDSKF